MVGQWINIGNHYNEAPIPINSKRAEQPKHYWVPAIATAGMTLVTRIATPIGMGNLRGSLANNNTRIENERTTFPKGRSLFQILEEPSSIPKVQMVTSNAVTERTGYGENESAR